MVEILSEKIAPVLGKQLLDIITSGMYDDPLSVYREYIQNSADSFDAVRSNSNDEGDQLIEITVDGKHRCVTIEDNGPGVPAEEIVSRLINIGCSNKVDKKSRGFRGIGRLGGLGYCKKLVMETKAVGEKKATIVTWDGELLRQLIAQADSEFNAIQLIRRVCTLNTKAVANEKVNSGYFKITMEDILKFHSDELVSLNSIKRYLAKTAPLPYTNNFSFSTIIESHVSSIGNYNHYKVMLNGEQLFKPYNDVVMFSSASPDRILDVVPFTFRDELGEALAYGWYAKLVHSSSIPISCNERGILVRDGNITVGNEYFLCDYFSERRFATWHIGEIFPVNGKMKVNARRDGFEHNSKYESFREQATLLGRHLSKVVREASKSRSAEQRAVKKIETIEKILGNGNVFLDQEDFNQQLKYIKRELGEIEEIFSSHKFLNGLDRRFKNARLRVDDFTSKNRFIKDNLDGRRLRKADKKELIEKVCRIIKENYDDAHCAEELIAKVLIPYVKGD